MFGLQGLQWKRPHQYVTIIATRYSYISPGPPPPEKCTPTPAVALRVKMSKQAHGQWCTRKEKPVWCALKISPPLTRSLSWSQWRTIRLHFVFFAGAKSSTFATSTSTCQSPAVSRRWNMQRSSGRVWRSPQRLWWDLPPIGHHFLLVPLKILQRSDLTGTVFTAHNSSNALLSLIWLLCCECH